MYYQEGGQQDQIMQLIQAYAQMNQIDPNQLMQELQQMPAEQQQQAIQQMAESLQQTSEQADMTQAAMAYGGYTTGIFADGGMIRRADGSYSKRGLWDNIRANKGSGKKPTKQMLDQEKKIRAKEAAYGGMFANGGTNNAGFNALPDYVQAKILSNMGYGGYYDPMTMMDEGGEPNGSMALGQMSAVADKMSKLRQFISPEQYVDPWIASKLAVMDDSANAISDYMMYNPEAQDTEMEMEMEEEMKRGGSTFSGNAFYQEGGETEPQIEDYPDYNSYMAALEQSQPTYKVSDVPQQMSPRWHSEWEEEGIDPQSNVSSNASRKLKDYKGTSVVDFLAAQGMSKTDYASRKELAKTLGISNYRGTAAQNMQLIQTIKSSPDILNMPSVQNIKSSAAKPILKSKGTSVSKGSANTSAPKTSGTASTTKTSVNTPPVNTPLSLPINIPNSSIDPATLKLLMEREQANRSYISQGKGSNPYANTVRDPYDDSYMLNKIDKDPRSQANINKRKRQEFATNLAIGTLAPWLAEGALMAATTRYLPYGLTELPQVVSAARNASKALPYATRALPFKQGGINLDPAKRGTFKAQATRMGMGVQEAASAILNAPEGRYSPAMRKKANFAKNFAKQMGGPVEGEVMEVSPEQLESLRQQGYQFEIM
jgi:hypothetical protein